MPILFAGSVAAQVKLTTTDIMYIRQKVQISTDTSKYFTSITDTISAASTHLQAPTAKAVYMKIAGLGSGPDGHVIADAGTALAQRDTLNFLDNDIAFSIANTATRTQVTATIAADSVTATHIAADAVGNSELMANAVDSINVVNGGLSVLDIGQHGASSGQVLKWNGTQWLPSTDSGVTGSGTDGQVTYWGASGITGEAALNYDAANNRLGLNKSSPAVTLDIQAANGSDGARIQTDAVDQDVWGLEMVGTATGPYTQRGRVSLDVFSSGGSSPDGHSLNFVLARDGGSTYTPLSIYNNQALFNRATAFTIANNTAELRLYPNANSQIRLHHTVAVLGDAFTTLDTAARFRVGGRTQASGTYSAVFNDGNAQRILGIRDDRRVGINTATIDAALTVVALGATSGTYGLIVTPSGGTTSTASIVVRDDNRVGIRTNAPQAPLNVVGTGTTSGTTAMLVEGSGGQDNLTVRDDGVVIGQGLAMTSSAPTITFGSAAGTGPTNDLCAGGANGFFLSFTTGASPGTNAAIFTATLPKSYTNGVVATVSCGDGNCLNEMPDIYISGTANNAVTISTRSTLTASTSHLLYVTIFGY